ncbi:methylated-DNA--[protein]-cysteine S-methyltransferase [Svornostia abyssi]|uniref:Methylated-DNA--[protein]-cysteine S-methyltransferase n=1 Tax=Svornostia abyssi TaxID=2898438 RepID=A0ABY5PFC2_9ACTN|nr:methylated-DNA--[protein]-cysteine S-methyltransferase [Parviterribacteraceae bacterium J379]
MTELQPPAVDATALAARFAARAADSGDADVAYAVVDTPAGRVVAARTPTGLVRLAYEDFNGGLDRVLESLAVRLSPRIVEAPARLDDTRRELDEYFAGTRHAFDVPIDWTLTTPFARRVLQATAAIPFGQTSTYAQIAAAAGSPRGARPTGNALGSNPIPIIVPCHRVLATGGGLGGYTGGLSRKELLLGIEGVLLG